MVSCYMEMYKLYTYKEDGISPDDEYITEARYITDQQNHVKYYKFGDGPWSKSVENNKMNLIFDNRMVLDRQISEKEAEELMFLSDL
jgi:hypothetical protein